MMPPAASRPSPRLAAQALVAVAVFLVAYLPRTVGLETFVTTDEIFWAGRTGNFARALAEGRLAGTFQTGHPGVTTMWAGLLGMGSAQAQRLAGERREVSRSQVSRQPDFLPALFAARRAVILVTALVCAATTLLAWRLLGLGPALLGGALLAVDPFFLAHSQVLHIDALLAGFMTLALLAGLVRWLAGGGRGLLALSAISTGLALLSKSPALILLAFLPLVALAAAWRRGDLLRRATWLELLAWGAAAGLTWLACWPALWAAPVETARGLLAFVGDNANPRHAALAEGGAESGPLFYPAVVALRSTPLTLAGLALLLVEALLARRRPLAAAPLTLLGFALLFGAALTATAKSFDRYLLPAFPALDLLAGLGLSLSLRRLNWLGGSGWLLAGTFILPLMVYPLAASLPYALDWYNPLAGGGPAAQRALTVGWGEGLDQVARYLNTRPGAERLKVALPGEIYTTVLDAQFVGQVMPAEGGDPSANDAAYYVTYIRAQQDGPPAYDPRFQRWDPELAVRLAGVELARVYPTSVGIPLGATFGDGLRLEGYGVDVLASRPGRTVNVKLFWRAAAAAPPETRVVLALRDGGGGEQLRAESRLGSLEPNNPRPRTYALALPAALAPGEYLLWAHLEGPDGRPLPLAGRPANLADGAPESPNEVVLRTIQVVAR